MPLSLQITKYGSYQKIHCPREFNKTTRKNAIVEYLDNQIPVTQLKGPVRTQRYST